MISEDQKRRIREVFSSPEGKKRIEEIMDAAAKQRDEFEKAMQWDTKCPNCPFRNP